MFGSPISSAHHSHQFRNLFSLIRSTAARYRVLNAMRHMIAQQFFFDPAKCGTHSRYLGDDIDAIAVLVYHPG